MVTRRPTNDHGRHERLLATLERLLEVEETDLVGALTGAAQVLAEVLDADKADALLPDPAGTALVAVGTSDTPMGRKQRALGLDRLPFDHGGRSVQVYQTGRPYLDGHVDRDPEELTGIKLDLGIRSSLAVPLEVSGVCRGVVLVSAARPEAFNEEDLAFLRAVARWIGTLVDKAELAQRSEQQRVERAAADLERKRLHDLFMSVPAAVAVLRGSNHVFTLANPLFRQVVGRNRDLDDRPVREALPEIADQGHIALLDRVYATGEPFVGREMRILFDRQDNGVLEESFFTFVYQPISGAAEVDGILVHAVDVTDLVRARQSVEALAAEREAILSQMAEGVIVADPEGRIVFVNAAAQRLHGTTELGVPVERYSQAYHLLTLEGEPYPPEELPLARAVRRGETVVDAVWRVQPPGLAGIVAQGSAAPVYAHDGTRLGNVLVVRDVTAQHELERQKDQFLASASHDLKNPLTTIKGVAQLLRRQAGQPGAGDPDRLRSGLSSIEAAAERIVLQIDEMLDATRLRLGRPLELERHPTDLVRLAQAAVVAHQATTDRHHIELETSLVELIGAWDPRRLQRALDNLIGNAIKYSPQGGEILVTVTRQNDGGHWAVLAVQDQGLGIPADDLPFLFVPYRRGSNLPGSIGGVGLGLAGAYQIVEQHGGRLEVASVEGQGSTFTVRLPL